MHYYIDGYNMLFRLLRSSLGADDLQAQREQIIQDINKKAALANIDVTIVFDSTYQAGDRAKSHFDFIEILFSAEGETADEFIIDELKDCLHAYQETVVTSDKKLSWRARRKNAHTQTVEEFYVWLNKVYKNKSRSKKEPQVPAPKPSLVYKKKPVILTPEGPLEERENYYAQIFEDRFKEFVEKEEIKKENKKISQNRQKKPRKKEPKEVQDPIEKAKTENERWLKHFEERFKAHEQDDFSLPK